MSRHRAENLFNKPRTGGEQGIRATSTAQKKEPLWINKTKRRHPRYWPINRQVGPWFCYSCDWILEWLLARPWCA